MGGHTRYCGSHIFGETCIYPTYIDLGESDIPAISLRFSEAKITSDIKFICQIFFRAKCFSKFNVSQVLTKASPMDYPRRSAIIYGPRRHEKSTFSVSSLPGVVVYSSRWGEGIGKWTSHPMYPCPHDLNSAKCQPIHSSQA